MALERKLFVQQSTGYKILEVKESIHGFQDTKVSYHYTGICDDKWFRLSLPNGGFIDNKPYLFEALKRAEHEEWPESVEWDKKYHLPKAEVINV